MPVSVVMVDDHLLVREALRALLSTQPDMRIVGEAGDAAETYKIVERTRPDVVILDIVLSHADGISVARELRQRHPDQRILMLSMFIDEDHASRALAAGATGYASKEASAEELFSAIRLVARGDTYLAPGISRGAVAARPRPEDDRPPSNAALLALTHREREVFDLIIQGRTTATIAAQLAISPRTVETHRSRIMRKLGVHSATDIVRLAARLGLLDV
jgi:two-component system response regulator NreC